MSSRRLKVELVDIENCTIEPEQDSGLRPQVHTILHIEFSRKLTQLEVSGVRAILDGEIK